jgi:SAM-dependent methyltransferase
MSRNKGFGNKKDEPVIYDPLVQQEGRIYSMPALYDLAFGYRNFEHEVDFLLYAHEQFTGSPATSVLELAAGPARHSLGALLLDDGSIRRATALDLSPEMVHYGQDLASHELGEAIASFQYLEGDMRNFDVTQTHDTAWILLGSLQHMTTNDDVLACFRNVHNALNKGGTLILELPHPRETFSMVECTRNGWEVPLEDDAGDAYGELQIVWGDENDTFDPISQVRQFSVSMEIKSDLPVSGLKSVHEIVPIRLFTSQEICAFATFCDFEVVAMFGALDEEVNVDDEEAFRLVCVLRKNTGKQ